MTHDSFCRLANKPGAIGLDPCPECFGGEHDIFCPVMDSSVAVPYCSCARIEMIRKDERESAAKRIWSANRRWQIDSHIELTWHDALDYARGYALDDGCEYGCPCHLKYRSLIDE